MIPGFPTALTFKFTSVVASSLNSVSSIVPWNMAVYGVTIFASEVSTNFYNYQIQFTNYNSGINIFDEPIQGFNLQTTAETYWPLASPWFLQKNETVICELDPLANSRTETYYVTLLGYQIDNDPSPNKKPFCYSFPMLIGFQDNVGGGASTVSFNQQVTQTLAKHALHDFELVSLTLDPFGISSLGAGELPYFSFQVSLDEGGQRKLFDRLVINGTAGGGSNLAQGNFINNGGIGNGVDFNHNVFQYFLPQPELVKAGNLMRVDIAPAPTYLASSDIHVLLNQQVCMALIGSHVYG